jgi:ABC-type sulfate transport system permease component
VLFRSLIRSARMAFRAAGEDYVNAARSLGASEWRIFWRVMLPLSFRPILTASAIVFARVFTEFAATLWLAARLAKPLP